jgi:hypothetical protein
MRLFDCEREIQRSNTQGRMPAAKRLVSFLVSADWIGESLAGQVQERNQEKLTLSLVGFSCDTPQ